MIFEISKCNKQCWTCPKDCDIKKMFVMLPEAEFNRIIIDSLKPSLGMYIIKSGNSKNVEKALKETAVALSIARKEYLKKYTS